MWPRKRSLKDLGGMNKAKGLTSVRTRRHGLDLLERLRALRVNGRNVIHRFRGVHY